MGFDRRWLESEGSEDSHGRTLWALGAAGRRDPSVSRRKWARGLFREALPVVEGFSSPRAWAFTLLGLDAIRDVAVPDAQFEARRQGLADRLMGLLAATETAGWSWFEDGLSYDNARLSQALIVTGISSGSSEWVSAGLRTLEWLVDKQTSSGGLFRPIGTDGFGDKRATPRIFDQQPVEAAATIAACLAAWRASGDPKWKSEASRAFAWFHGRNDLRVSLIDGDSGGCRDGLHPDRRNENQGGESIVSYLLALADVRRLARIGAATTVAAQPRQSDAANSLPSNTRGRLGANNLPQPAGPLPSA